MTAAKTITDRQRDNTGSK